MRQDDTLLGAAVPVPRHRRIAADIDVRDPVDQRRTAGRRFANRIGDELAVGVARHDHGPAGEEGRRFRGAAPQHAARVDGLHFGRIEHAARDGVDAVRGDQDVGFVRRQSRAGDRVRELRGHAAAIVPKRLQAVAGVDAIGSQPFQSRIEQQLLKQPAMQGILRPVVTCCQTARLAPDGHAELVVIGQFRRRDAGLRQARSKTEDGQFAHGVRQQIQPDSQLPDFRGGFEDLAIDTQTVQAERGGKPAGARADDGCFHAPQSGNMICAVW